jgi:hypothetical protein
MAKFTLIAPIFMLVAGWSCAQNSEHERAFELKESSMMLEKENQFSMPAIAPIDAAAPADYETATFGLG